MCINKVTLLPGAPPKFLPPNPNTSQNGNCNHKTPLETTQAPNGHEIALKPTYSPPKAEWSLGGAWGSKSTNQV